VDETSQPLRQANAELFSSTTFDNISLQKGRHPIRALYYENSASESMDVSIEGPNLPKQPIPPYNLFLPN
jgi:hypothetical protein